jgi:hypothetical protein
MTLGGWASPHGGKRQVEYMLHPEYSADFYLAQIVSHYQTQAIDDFVNETERLGVKIPGIFGVFYWRTSNPKTFAMLSKFLPVPVEELTRDLAAGLTPDEICARSVHAVLQRGVKNIYISNLPMPTATATFSRVESRVEEMLVIS